MALPHALRIMDASRARGAGVMSAIAHPPLFADLFKLMWGRRALTRSARSRLMRRLAADDGEGACAVLLDRASFRRSAVHALFWSLTEASGEIARDGRRHMHEPELNGAFMGMIEHAISSFPADGGCHVAAIIGDHATLGNEARTGADFGLIIELVHNGETRHLVTLLQAKRATGRRTDVSRAAGETTQIDLLVASGIGSFLFYHAHGDPQGLGPTVRDAHAIKQTGAVSADVLHPTDDFAVRIAVAADELLATSGRYALPGAGAAGSRGDAVRLLFNPGIPGIRVNGVVVARIGDQGLHPREAAAFESDWRDLVDEHRRDVGRARGELPIAEEGREPPLAFN